MAASARAIAPASRRRRSALRVALALVALAASTAPAFAAPSASRASTVVRAATPSACPVTADVTRQQIYGCLDLPSVAADYVVLIDVSGSMQTDQFYPRILRALPQLLGTLAGEPGAQVAVDTFSSGLSPHPLGAVGDPAATIAKLPPTADGANTDFGAALNYAYGQLAGSKAPVGAVFLLSDGAPDPPADSTWSAYGNPGWMTLQKNFTELGKSMQVNGYGIELDQSADLGRVLGQVFPNPVTLSVDSQDVANVLANARAGVQAAAAAAVLQKGDSDAGVTARLTGSDGTADGLTRLDLSKGRASALLTLSNTAAHVPLTVSGLSVTAMAAGFTVSAQLSESAVTLAPQSSPTTIPVELTWMSPARRGLAPAAQHRSTTLVVHGTVSSPWADTIHGEIGDAAFSAGTLSAARFPMSGTAAGVVSTADWSLLILAALLALALVGLLVLFCVRRPRLRGSVTVFGYDNSELGRVALSGWSSSIDERRLREMPARATVRGFRRGPRDIGVRITCERLDTDAGGPETRNLMPGEEMMIKGLRFVYQG